MIAAAPPTAPPDDGSNPWMVAAIITAVVLAGVWSCWRAWRTAKRRVAAERDALAEHHRVRWDTDPAALRPTSRHWSLSVAAIFGICTGDPWDRLRHSDTDLVRAGLAEAWGIHSRGQLLAQLHALLVAGHRFDFAHEQAFWAQATPEVAEQIATDLAGWTDESEEAAETLWRFKRVRENDRDIRSVDFLAWDLVRFTMLARAGYTAGYLSEAESLDTMAIVAPLLRDSYRSWEELGQHFLRGRWYWASTGGPQQQENDEHDASRQAALLDPATGPWPRVPWNLPVDDSRLLLLDALLREDLLTAENADDDRTPEARWFGSLIRDRLEREPGRGGA